jgi:hypothetical protein
MKARDEGNSFRRTTNEDEIETSGTRGGSAGDDCVPDRGSCVNDRTHHDQCPYDQCSGSDLDVIEAGVAALLLRGR